MTAAVTDSVRPYPEAAPVSIVIAVWQGLAALDRCLEALARQRDDATEVIVVSNFALPASVATSHPWVRLVATRSTLLIPHLWSAGIAQSTHPIVAITTAHFVPAPSYLRELRQAHARLDTPAIGGAIDPPAAGDVVTWATYFLRYSTYLDWDSERRAADFAGDNASYKGAALQTAHEIDPEGFWEQPVHRALLASGHVLYFVPDIRVTQAASFGFGPFCVQRFRHGREFGRERIERDPSARLMRIATAPLVPFLLLGRVVQRVMRSGRNLGALVRSLPVLICFVLAWSLGETAGYLARRRIPSPTGRG
jgi:hypothetical protein